MKSWSQCPLLAPSGRPSPTRTCSSPDGEHHHACVCSSAALPPSALQALGTFWYHVRVTRSTTVSSTTFFAYEFFITLPDEVEYFWGSHWSFTKILFFLNRYYRLLASVLTTYMEVNPTPSQNSCMGYGEIGTFTGVAGACITEIILIVRLHALYGQNKYLLIVLSILFFLQMASIIALGSLEAAFLTSWFRKSPAVLPFIPFCNGVTIGYFFAFCIPYIVFDFILVALAAHKTIEHYRRLPRESWSSASLMAILMRDSLVYFVLNFSVYLANLLLWQRGPHDLYTAIVYWCNVIPAVAANRLLINMKKAKRPQGDLISTEGLQNLSTLQIGGHVRTDETESWLDSEAGGPRRINAHL